MLRQGVRTRLLVEQASVLDPVGLARLVGTSSGWSQGADRLLALALALE